jgi:hypothetical protein
MTDMNIIRAARGAVLTKAQQTVMTRQPSETRQVFLDGLTLSIFCAISYWLITHILAHMFSISRDDDLLGGMWP